MAHLYEGKSKRGEDDLQVLFPNRLLRIREEVWTLREYGFVEEMHLMHLGKAVATAITEGKPVDEPALIALLAAATGKDSMEIAALDTADFDALRDAWIAVNQQVFLPKQSRRRTGKPGRWVDVFASLIAAGHDHAKLRDYTKRQILLFYESAQRSERRARAGRLSDTNLAFAGGNKANQQLKSLNKDPHEE